LQVSVSNRASRPYESRWDTCLTCNVFPPRNIPSE